MENYYIKICVIVLTIVISASLLYGYIIRPIQKDRKLESCLNAASYVKDEWYKYQNSFCIEKYK